MDNYRPAWAEIVTGIAGAVAEWLFTILPLVVVAVIVTLYLGELSPWFKTPEWAFGTSILAGQALVRFFAGAVRVANLSLKRVLLSVSVLSTITVVPTNIVLILVLQSDLSKNFVSSLLATLQVVLFFLSSVLFILIGTIAHLSVTGNNLATRNDT